MSTFNAWSDPWLPVDDQDSTSVVSLRDLFLRAHLLQGLGPGLTPLDRDSIYRLLVSLAAVILRECTDEEWDDAVDESRFPARAVDAFDERFHARFALNGERPFLQRWDRTQADLAALFSLDVDDKKERAARAKARQTKLQPLGALHQHVPGGSSSKWAVLSLIHI